MKPKRSPQRNYLIYILLALATACVYWQVHSFEFISIDDFIYASENPRVLAGLSGDSIRYAFTTNYGANWHPLTWLSLMADAQLAKLFAPGFAAHPTAGVFHVTNAVLHIIDSLLLFAALFALTGKRWRCAFVAALFALHPLHVESVAWVSERKDVLSALFWMLTMLAYTAYAKRPSAVRYILTLLAFALGLMAKPMLVSLPLVLLLLDYWPLARLQQGRKVITLLIEKLPFFALAGASCVVTCWAQNASGAMVEFGLTPLGQRLANAVVSTMSYIGKALSPVNLAMFYPHPGPHIPTWQVIGAGVLVMAAFAVAIALRKRYPPVTMGWFWYVITLLPVIGIVQVGSQAMADRYTYIPLIGHFIAATWAADDAFAYAQSRFNSALLTAPAKSVLALAILAGLAATTYFQVGYWRNTIALTEHTIAVTRSNYFAHAMLGTALHKAGRDDEALQHCVESVRIRRDYADGHYRLATVLASKRLLSGAIAHFRMALRNDPKNADIHNDLGCVLGVSGDLKAAADEFTLALKLDPQHPKATRNLQEMLSKASKGVKPR